MLIVTAWAGVGITTGTAKLTARLRQANKKRRINVLRVNALCVRSIVIGWVVKERQCSPSNLEHAANVLDSMPMTSRPSET